MKKAISFVFIVLLVLTLSAQAVVPVPNSATPQHIKGAKPRSVVFILSDDHRYDAMSFMGHQFAQTPHMDSLAENSPRRAASRGASSQSRRLCLLFTCHRWQVRLGEFRVPRRALL